MWSANRKAQNTVMNSATPQVRCGGPWIKPAPNVASPTPKIIIFVGSLKWYTEEIIAVKTTYREVKNADTEGSMSSSPII